MCFSFLFGLFANLKDFLPINCYLIAYSVDWSEFTICWLFHKYSFINRRFKMLKRVNIEGVDNAWDLFLDSWDLQLGFVIVFLVCICYYCSCCSLFKLNYSKKNEMKRTSLSPSYQMSLTNVFELHFTHIINK